MLGAVLASWEAVLSWGRVLSACAETKLLFAWELLPSWEGPSLEGVLLGGTVLASWDVTLSRGELVPAWEGPSLEGVLLRRTALASWEALLPQGRGCLPACLPACLRRN